MKMKQKLLLLPPILLCAAAVAVWMNQPPADPRAFQAADKPGKLTVTRTPGTGIPARGKHLPSVDRSTDKSLASRVKPKEMTDLDTRKLPTVAEITEKVARERAEAIAQFRKDFPNAYIDFDPVSHSPRQMTVPGLSLTGPLGGKNAKETVISFVEAYKGLFGHGSNLLSDPGKSRVITESEQDGVTHLVWEQLVNGIPVEGRSFSASVASDGSIVALGDLFVADGAAAASPAPAVTVEQAISVAVNETGMQMDAAGLKESSGAAVPSPEYVKHHGSGLSGESQSRLIWFPQGDKTLALAWDVTFKPANRMEMFRAMVDASDGSILFRQSMSHAANYNAQVRMWSDASTGQPIESPKGQSPTNSTASTTTEPANTSQQLVTYLAPPVGTTNVPSPNGWLDLYTYVDQSGVTHNVLLTLGSNVDATSYDGTGYSYPVMSGVGSTANGNQTGVFDFTANLTVEPSDATTRLASAVSAFALCNWMHDSLWNVGFKTADGAFEGAAKRAVVYTQVPGAANNAISFSTNIPSNGSPEIYLGLMTGPSPDRDTAFDADVVLHEYTHGMVNRLVGAGTATIDINSLQPASMNEGWADFYAMAMLSRSGDALGGNYVAGEYYSKEMASGFNTNYYFADRRYPYSTNVAVNPLTFKDIDPYQASPHSGVPLSPRYPVAVNVPQMIQNDMSYVITQRDFYNYTLPVPSATVARSGNQVVVTGTINGLVLDISVSVANGGSDNTQSISVSTVPATPSSAQVTTITPSGRFEFSDSVSFSYGYDDGFNNFSSGLFDSVTDAAESHTAGEAWAMMLWEARANVIQNKSFATGNDRILKLVTAAMKLVPHPNPTWIEERNNILSSDNAAYGREDEPEIWAGFAKRGMGIGASAPAATTTTGVVESFDLAIPLGSTTVAAGGSFDVYGWGLGAVPAAGGIPAQSKVSVTIGGAPATVQNNGVAPTLVPTQASQAIVANAGRISITVPGSLGNGTHAVVLSHYGWSQNVGSITVQSPEIAVEQPVGTNIADGGSKNFGSVVVGSPASLTFTIKNTGTASLTGLTSFIDGTNAGDFALTTAPTAPVASSGTTTFEVTFTPGGGGTRTAAIHFTSNDADENPFDITLTGTGLVPEIAVEQPAGTNVANGGSKNFGTILPGTSTSLTFTINNTGGAPLTGLTPTIDGTHSADFALTTAPSAPVAASGNTTFTITFTPGAAGTRSAAIHFANNDGDENPFDINLTGTGASPEIAVEQPAGANLVDGSVTANFGSVLTGSTSSLTFTLKNTGTADLTGISTSISGTNAGDFVVTTAPASSVAAAGSTTLTVTFTAGGLGARTAALQIASNDSDENPFDIALSGTGTLPEITVSMQGSFPALTDGDTTPTTGEGTALGTTFAETQTIVKNVVIKNDGTAALNLGTITVTGASFTTNLAGVSTSLAPGASTHLPITFQAAAGGVYQATVQIPSNDADEGTFDFVVSASHGAVTSVNNNELVRLSPLPSSWTIGATGLELAGVTTAAILDGTGASVLTLSINSGTRTNTFLDLSTTTLPTTLTGEYFLGLDGNSTGISIYIRNTGPRLKVDGADKPALVTANFIGEVRVAPAVINGVAAEPATATTTVTLTNTGESTLTVTAMPKTGTGNADFTLAPTNTSYTILAGASRVITVTFNPAALGARNADYGITSNSTLYPSGVGGYFAKFEGTGVDPDIELTPFTDDTVVIADDDVTPNTTEGTEYGTVAVNDYSNNWGFFSIWNKGTSPLTIVSVTMLAGSTNSLVEFPLQTSTYPLEIGPGGSDTIYVGFQPLAAATTVKYATVRILCNDNNAGASTAESDYRFRVQGKCLRPVLEVRGKGNVITSNAAPTGANGTALGSAVINSGYVERSFKLSNLTNMAGYQGNDGMAITFDNIEILPSAAGNTSYLDFYASWPGSIWGAGLGFPNYDSLYVSCSPTATGARTALIKLTSNASLSATVTTPQVFSLRVSATGTTTPLLGTGPDTTDFTSHATVSSGTALVSAMVVDGEGRTLVAGNFTSINGTARTRLARFDADGVLDTTFNPTINNTVNCITVQPSGDILIGGIFTQVNGVNRGRLARLHSDGTLDANFRAGANTSTSAVNSITWMPSVQKWLIGGNFVQFGIFPTTGTTAATSLVGRYRLALVDDTGALDSTFNLAANPGSATFAAATTVNSIVVDTAGRVWIGGGFTQVGNIGGTPQARGNLAVILPGAASGAGGLDTDCATPSYTGGAVNCIVPEPQGTIMVGGDFTGGTSAYGTLLTSTQDYLQRLDLAAGGSGQPVNLFVFNTSFTPVLAAGGVNTVACQAGGGLLVGGLFTSITAKTVSFATGSEVVSTSPATLTRIRLARLDVNGNVDADFNPNYGLPGTPTASCAEMNGITIDETGDVYLGGRFTYIGATQRTNAARLSNPIATYGFSRTSTQLAITSSEASPTPLAVTFEVWDAGLEQWTTVGEATWNGAQWVLPLGSPVSGSTRAKCVIPGGLGNASTGLVYYY
ncbi:MAG: choice-of-anchor D domain-containing protein [Prosthecobacter sp.]